MKRYFYSLLLLGFLLLSQSCEDFVEVSPPDSQLNGVDVFESKSTATAALMDLYSKMRDSGLFSGRIQGAGASLGIYADELIYYGANDSNMFFLYNNTLQDDTSIVGSTWNQSYHLIYCANTIIAGCETSVKLSETDKEELIGEALFVRAMVHFTLASIYGSIPYVDTTDYQINRLANQISTTEVYNRVIEDLERAIPILSENYIGDGRARVNRYTAYSLLAKTYLHQEDWSSALTTASMVLNQPLYSIVQDLDQVFLRASPETIWHYSPAQEGHNAAEASAFNFQTGPPPVMSLRDSFVELFSLDDLRKTHWIRAITNSNGSWHHSYKYKLNTNTGTSQELSVVFRLAEIYLIRAEARARQGDLTGAAEDVNVIRQRAGLTPVTANNASDLLQIIMNERRFELFTEQGHRFFDLKRTNQLNVVLGGIKPSWSSYKQLWPIPLSDLSSNPNLIQNPGY